MSHTVDIAQRHKAREVDHGKVGKATTHLAPGEGTRSLWMLGQFVTHKVPSHQTGGAYALFEATTQPGAGPPPHIHHREDESFYVLEGEYEFLSGRETLRAGADSLLYVPKGVLHAHTNVGESVGRLLLTQTPGGLYELFFEKAGRPVHGDDAVSPASEDRPNAGMSIVEVAAEHGIEIPPPFAGEAF
jgi:mannose-6-phosphate isomerase-like protein (cupin superfamily)